MAKLSYFSSVFGLVISALVLNMLTNEVASRTVENLRVMRPARIEDANNGNVKIISKDTWQEYGLKPMPLAYYQRKTKKVDTQKFRQCIFFQLCSKSECFHYGRYNACS